jgi:hypothetical protein
LFFYNGFWPRGNRYDFPGLLYIPASIFILLWLGLGLAPVVNKGFHFYLLKTSFTVALMLMVIIKGYNQITQTLDLYVKETNEFHYGLQNIVSRLREHEDYALVIESSVIWDYEPVFSYEIFLRSYGVKNKLFLRINGYSLETANSDWEKGLTSQLLDVSEKGNGEFLPLNLLKTFGDKCFSFSLSGSNNTTCIPIE